MRVRDHGPQARGGGPRSRRRTRPRRPGSPGSCRAGTSATRSPARPSASSPQGAFPGFQQADGYRPPVRPPAEGAQRPMMHLGFQVGDPESAVAEALALGATLADHQPQRHVRALFDPAAHPFCLCRDDGPRPRARSAR
ncbi:VOC family protein [Kitasatospora sp. NPDC096147]|uniref:VOC family protein n=1 Tax=Kitasatospora sp. NPDC096147 TaxID=3364093 RepID=UPI0037F9C13D